MDQGKGHGQAAKRRINPQDEWWPEPKKKVEGGKWRDRTIALAQAIQNGEEEVAVQLARMYWAGDPALAASK